MSKKRRGGRPPTCGVIKSTTRLIVGFFSHLKALFLTGLFTILPIILTIFILATTYDFIARWLKPLKNIQSSYLQNIPYLKNVPGLEMILGYLQAIPGIEFIIVILLLLVLGFLLKLVFITPIIHWFERVIKKIPFIRSVYSSSKIVVDFFNVSTSTAKKRKVVLIQFPRKGLYTIGFLLEPATESFQKLIPKDQQKPGQTYYKVFMPNSPTPATGHFFILPEEEIIPTDITFDEAIKAVVSCGLITPKSALKLDDSSKSR